jgi:hypothetical protein
LILFPKFIFPEADVGTNSMQDVEDERIAAKTPTVNTRTAAKKKPKVHTEIKDKPKSINTRKKKNTTRYMVK